MGEGHAVHPKAHAGPPRATSARPKSGEIAASPLGLGWQATADLTCPANAGSEEPHSPGEVARGPEASSLSQTTRRLTNHRRFTLGEPPTQLSGESQSSLFDSLPDVTPSRERNAQSPCSVDHRSIVTDREPAASREALRWPLEGSQAIRCRCRRCVSASAVSDATRSPSRPEAATDHREARANQS